MARCILQDDARACEAFISYFCKISKLIANIRIFLSFEESVSRIRKNRVQVDEDFKQADPIKSRIDFCRFLPSNNLSTAPRSS